MSTDKHDKENELILVIPRSTLNSVGISQGFHEANEAYLKAFFAPGVPSFTKRGPAEKDSSQKQLIPYCIITHAGEILTYRRGNSGGEVRLHAKYSLGIGGHINPIDANNPENIDLGAYESAVLRELHEELVIPQETKIVGKIVGLINDDSNPVGEVHLGIVEVFDLPNKTISSGEDAIAELKFLSIKELKKLASEDQLESWSEIVVDEIEKIMPVKDYHFSAGNSNNGPIGFCASIMARSASHAVTIMKDHLPQEYSIKEDSLDEDETGVNYLNVYFNENAITEKDISYYP